MCSSGLGFRVLGPLTVVRDGSEIGLGGPRQRLVLALLLVNAGRVVPAERLVDEVWGETAPTTGTGPLRTYVWQLRRLLAPDADTTDEADQSTAGVGPLLSRPPGYLLDIDRDQIDSFRFEAWFAEARTAAASGQPRRALSRLGDALGLWGGAAFDDLAAAPCLQSEATRLDQLHLGAEELRAELLLATGQHAEVTAELGELARANPHREHLWAMCMTALYRSGRQSEALRCFQDARDRLIDELGIEPGPELRELEQAVLRQDQGLDWQPRPGRDEDELEGSQPATTPDARHNLPVQLTSFVGRGAERAMVVEVLAESRLVTLAGSGGCGKTRLALAVAEDVVERFAGGVWFVDLAAVSDPALVARAIAGPLRVESEQAGQLDFLCRRIGDEELLLVLDNCEHLVDGVAGAIEVLLSRCASLRILATSREEMRIGAEVVWRVPALSLPVMDTIGPDRDRFLGSEAVELFIERGRSALAGFAPTGESLGAVAQICRRLDGIPLAIELAAALVGSLPVVDIADRLDDRLRLLGEGWRLGVERHRTLGATLDWSFDLLDEPARRLFMRLGVFVGDFTLAAAERVAGTEGEPLAVVRGLGRLVATSMVGCVSGSEGADRYRMLETVRQYARERLEESGEADEMCWRHARYYADFAAEAERHVHGRAASAWLAHLTSELPNLRAAVAWAFAHDDVETGVRLAGSLRWYFARVALLDEAAHWLDLGLRREAKLPADLRLLALTAAGVVAYSQGEFSRTREFGEEAIALARELKDPHQLANALIVRGAAVVYEGDLTRAEECFEEARILFARLGNRWSTAWMLTCWAVASRREGELERARRQLQEALEIFGSLGDRHGQVLPLVNLSFAAQEGGQVDEARDLASEAVRLAVEVKDRQLQHISLCALGRVEMSLGHLDQATKLLMRSIRDYHGAHNRLMLAIALEGLAGLAAMAGRHGDAAALLGFTQQMRERWRISVSNPRRRERDSWLDEAKATVGPDELELSLKRGHGLNLDEAVDLAEAATDGLGVVREAPRGDVLPP